MQRIWMMLAVALGCSSTDDTIIVQDVDLVPGEQPTAEYLDFLAEFEDENGPTRILDEDEEIEVEPGVHGYDGGDPNPDPTAEVEKTQVPVVWGYAVKSTNYRQSLGRNPKAHCDQFGLSCDGLNHNQATDIFVDDYADWTSDSLGRCGRFDSGMDNSFKACAVPYGIDTTAGKTWSYKVDFASCPDNQYGRDVFLWGARTAVQYLDATTDLTFVETTGTPTLLITCEGAVGIPPAALASGTPDGALTLRFASTNAFEEICETASESIPPTNGAGNYSYHFSDMYYTYGKAKVRFNWNGFWVFANGCDNRQTLHRNIARAVMLHELGHAFGFTHQNWTDTRTLYAGWTELMQSTITCHRAERENISWHPNMVQAINEEDIPRNSLPLTVHDTDISCLFPQ